jgi:diguanylate cyclase (GGDEF)-like protein
MQHATETSNEPRWLQRLTRVVLRHGLVRATVVFTLAVTLLSVAGSQLVISLLGHGNRSIAAVTAAVCCLLVAPLMGSVVLRLVFALERARQKLAVLATQDELTDIHNRRHFMTLVQREWARAHRYSTDAALLLIDVDHFKRVNDAHGHLCGDELLRRIAHGIADSLRQPDVLARFGGEEFVVFLPQTDPLGALDVAERIREGVQALQLPWHGVTVGVTVSIGVAPLRPDLLSLDWSLHEADTALYAAKAAGRNCVRTVPIAANSSGDTHPVSSR